MKISVLINLLFSCSILLAQDNVSSSANEASSDNGSVSYIIGQAFYLEVTTEEGSVSSLPVLTPYEVEEVTDLVPEVEIELLSVYPNPVQNQLVLNLGQYLKGAQYQVLNVSGQQLLSSNLDVISERLDFSNYSSGVYFVNVLKDQKIIKTFKVFKN